MDTTVMLMTVLAFLPSVVLLIYIYKKDRMEKEPAGLLIGLFFLGVLSVIPSVLLELAWQAGLNAVFFGRFSADTPEISAGTVGFFYHLLNNFICIALVEEGFKWIFTFLVTRNSRHFNSLFDGVVYCVFVSLGFATAENLLYVFENGVANALLRMVTAVPAHCFFAVIMGCFYSRWHLSRKAGQLEEHLRSVGVIPPGEPVFRSGRLLFLSLLLPALAHGFYDFCATMGEWEYMLLFFLFLVLLYIFCFRSVRQLSKADMYSSFLSMDMVLRRYPQAAGYVSTLPEFAPYFVPIQQK